MRLLKLDQVLTEVMGLHGFMVIFVVLPDIVHGGRSGQNFGDRNLMGQNLSIIVFMDTSSTEASRKKTDGLPLLGLSLGTFGLGLFIASKQNQKKRLRTREEMIGLM